MIQFTAELKQMLRLLFRNLLHISHHDINSITSSLSSSYNLGEGDIIGILFSVENLAQSFIWKRGALQTVI